MTDQELYQMVFFAKRPGMYLGNHEIKSIEGFLIGYDMAKNNQIGIQRELIKGIFENYRSIGSVAEMEKGNVHLLFRQIKEISKAIGKTELQIFKDEAMKILVQISDIEGNSRYKTILKEKLELAIKEDLKILEESNKSGSQQMSQVLQISKAIDEWKGENVNSKIKNLVIELKELQINSTINWMDKSESKTYTDEIIEVSNKILAQLKN